MKSNRKLIAILGIMLIATLACALPGSANPASSIQTLIPAEAQTVVAEMATMLTPAATDPAGSGGATSSACDNPLYPVVLGASWIYSITGPLPDTFTRSIAALTSDGFTDQDIFGSGITRTGQWSCNAGTLTALDPGAGQTSSANVQTTGLDSDFETTASDGVTFPSDITPGSSWAQNITLEGVQNLNGLEIPSKSETAYNCTAGEYESVTVPSGTFEAIRVDCEVDMTITITMSGMEIPTTMNSTTTTWLSTGVGIVKSDSILSEGSTITTELTAYNIP